MGDPPAEIVYDIQFPERIEDWIDEFPEYEMQVLAWRARLRHDPTAQDLERTLYPTLHRASYAYPVPGAPLVVVALVEEQPDSDGITWIWILKLLA